MYHQIQQGLSPFFRCFESSKRKEQIQGFEEAREEEVGEAQIFIWGFESYQGQRQEEAREDKINLL